ncbi:MAG TPA: short-chain fatty acid transporter [Thermoanaerobacterales bacterium]|nr:short-chain fatty acid transporter [Thermoanaerobacterales bacterium]
MLQKITQGCVNLVQKFLPDALIFALILTLVVFFMGMGLTQQSPLAMTIHWWNGFWNLLAFAMQMTLVIVTGSTLAQAPIFKKGTKAIASLPKNATQAVFLVSIFSAFACWINWGFGLVIGALLAREVVKRVKNVDYPLLIASAYSGLLVWHAGISASIPLTVATSGLATNFVEQLTGSTIPISQTIFSPIGWVASWFLILTLPLVNRAMHPKADSEVKLVDPSLLIEEELPEPDRNSFTTAEKIENSPILSLVIGIMGIVALLHHFATKGADLDLNVVNFIFLFASIILHGTPRRFIDAAADAVKGTAGVIVQFPFYAGIMGMMTGANVEGLSLAMVITQWFVNMSTVRTFPLFSFLSAGIVNFFVPSGGGQWAVQGPIMIPAALELGVDPAKASMAVAWGDAWTNMIQPFWALPALGIAGLGARDIMGYCIIALIYSGIVLSIAFLVL